MVAGVVSEDENITMEQAQAILRGYETVFMRADMAAILAGFSDDVVVHFGDYPEFCGKLELEKFLKARFARQKNYRVHKTLRAINRSLIANTFVGEWDDAIVGKKMKWRGSEFIKLKRGICVEWLAFCNIWDPETGLRPQFV
jgi:nuclear transport factor 2 (NTF2) superfamily protein